MYTYKLIENDEDSNPGFTIEARYKGQRIGHVDVTLECGGYGFTPYEDHPCFKIVGDLEETMCIETLSVDEIHRGIGLATQLMKRAMRYMAAAYEGLPCYLNASPMGDCMELDTLVEFYNKFGFTTIASFPQNRNALLFIAA